MRRIYTVIGLAVFALLLMSPTPVLAHDATIGGGNLRTHEPFNDRLRVNDAVRKINDLRRAKGLPTVTLSPALMRASSAHAQDLSRLDDLSHYGSNGSSPIERITKAGYSFITVGENLSAGQRDLDEALASWMGSKSHRKTIYLKSARHMGIALAYDPNTTHRTFWTLVMAEPF